MFEREFSRPTSSISLGLLNKLPKRPVNRFRTSGATAVTICWKSDQEREFFSSLRHPYQTGCHWFDATFGFICLLSRRTDDVLIRLWWSADLLCQLIRCKRCTGQENDGNCERGIHNYGRRKKSCVLSTSTRTRLTLPKHFILGFLLEQNWAALRFPSLYLLCPTLKHLETIPRHISRESNGWRWIGPSSLTRR